MRKSIKFVILSSALFAAFVNANAQKPEESVLVLEAVAPVFPTIIISAVERGRTTVEVIVGEHGQVESIGEVKAPAILRRTLSAAARKWRFVPVEEGSGVRKIELVFVLTMVSSDAKSEELFPVFRPPYEVETKVRAPIVSKDQTDN
jgi:hypothetical protein